MAVSSDSQAILEEAKKGGADFRIRRPDELATDTASKLPAIIHAVKEVEKVVQRFYEVIVELDPTSPLRSVEDIRETVSLLEKKNAMNVITASPARRSPYFNIVELNPQGAAVLAKPLPFSVIRRQDSPPCYDMNASIYVWKRGPFFENPAVFYPDTQLYVMPVERSWDIDSEIDFEMVEWLMQKQQNLMSRKGERDAWKSRTLHARMPRS